MYNLFLTVAHTILFISIKTKRKMFTLNLKIQPDFYIIIRGLDINKISKNKNYENKRINRFTYIKLSSNHYSEK